VAEIPVRKPCRVGSVFICFATAQDPFSLYSLITTRVWGQSKERVDKIDNLVDTCYSLFYDEIGSYCEREHNADPKLMYNAAAAAAVEKDASETIAAFNNSIQPHYGDCNRFADQ
jgi:hypothetical protein